jgi:membrane-bound metal-dependent hydrolase YbcI (DUF457 family)
VILGSLLPDIVIGVTIIMAFSGYFHEKVLILADVIHTPIGAFLISLLFALFLNSEYKKSVLYLNLGISLHLAVDSFQKPANTMLLWPLSLEKYSFGLIWVENYLPLMMTVAIIGVIALYDIIKGGT